MMAGWGTIPWGLGPFGTPPGPLSMSGALAVATGIIRVTLTAEPKHASGFSIGDALNPATWEVTRLDTMFAFTVLAAREYDPPFVFEVLVLEPLGPHLVDHRIAAPTLLSATGSPIVPPNFFDFDGVQSADLASIERRLAGSGHSLRDVANPPFPAGSTGAGGAGGTLVISGGDYASEQGVALLRKLIIRRLTTTPGEFYHLPDYGVGLRVKEPIPSGDLPTLRAEIERQVRREPEVDEVAAVVELGRQNDLTIRLTVRAKRTGQQFTVGLRSSRQGGVVVL